jgi:hypothetical protein
LSSKAPPQKKMRTRRLGQGLWVPWILVALGLLAAVGDRYGLEIQQLADRVLEELATGNALGAQSSHPSLAQAAPATPPQPKPGADRVLKGSASGDDLSTQTGYPSLSLAAPAAPPESKPAAAPVKIKTGIIRRQAKGSLVASLKITADANDYAIKLVDTKSNTDVLMIFIAADQTFETKVPLGTYKILAATGPLWYGEQLLFGASTRYFALHRLGGEDEFQFTFKKHTYYGHDIQLRPAVSGTLSILPSTANEFQRR